MWKVVGSLAALLAVAVASVKTEHYYDPSCRMQEYVRSILWVPIEALSERNYAENPGSGQCSHQVQYRLAARCWFIFGCTYLDSELFPYSASPTGEEPDRKRGR